MSCIKSHCPCQGGMTNIAWMEEVNYLKCRFSFSRFPSQIYEKNTQMDRNKLHNMKIYIRIPAEFCCNRTVAFSFYISVWIQRSQETGNKTKKARELGFLWMLVFVLKLCYYFKLKENRSNKTEPAEMRRVWRSNQYESLSLMREFPLVYTLLEQSVGFSVRRDVIGVALTGLQPSQLRWAL